jgi:hypothetical protein
MGHMGEVEDRGDKRNKLIVELITGKMGQN